MNYALQELIRVSNEVGKDPKLIQGGGGNTSFKTDDGHMYVKASGTALKDMNESRGHRCLDVEKAKNILNDESLESMSSSDREKTIARRFEECCVDEGDKRPSVESSVHALLGRCVIHTHPAVLGGVLCSQNSESVVGKLFGDMAVPYAYVEYVDFGYPLARRVQETVENYTREHDAVPQVVFLENHGLFVSADTGDDALELTRRITDKAEDAWETELAEKASDEIDDVSPERRESVVQDVSAAMRRTFQEVFGRTPVVMYGWGEPEERFLQNPEREKLSEVGPLVPDQVLYCNGGPMLLEGINDIEDVQEAAEKIVEKHEDGIFTPVALLVNGVGLFCAGPGYDLAESALATMEAALTMLDVASCFGGARALSPDALNNIRKSEWESYRHHIILGDSDVNDLSGAVAVVTGGGSGLGRGISIGLARKGMNVVLADIDVDSATETAGRISLSEAPGRGIPMEVNVTDENAVDELFHSIVKKLGGVDLLVNCAGIAPPAALLDFPVGAFRKALDINLTGYMLMAREATRVMKRQEMGGSIVNISSKSGLDASKNHSAYNATKAGEIHMARGWALELAEYKIRVNVVCPGNVFQESNIWNEDYIKALAEKRGLEPDEVIPYYIDMTALKEEIKWDDIANAVAFLAGEGSAKITGQTLVVDAGQVFVR